MDKEPDSKPSVERLAERAREGDRDAVDELLGASRERLVGYVRSRLGKSLEARTTVDDVVQDTILGAVGSIERFTWRGEESFFRWLTGIAENILRKANRRPGSQSLLRLDLAAPGEVSPSRALRRDERFDRLSQALGELSEDHRQVILLSRIEGLKSPQIAERMGRSEGAVRKLLVRALIELRRSFGETESFELPARSLDVEEDV